MKIELLPDQEDELVYKWLLEWVHWGEKDLKNDEDNKFHQEFSAACRRVLELNWQFRREEDGW